MAQRPDPARMYPSDVERLSRQDITGRLASIDAGRGNIDLLVLQGHDGMTRDYRQDPPLDHCREQRRQLELPTRQARYRRHLTPDPATSGRLPVRQG